MFFGKKKEPELPEPFGAESSFGSANYEEPPKAPAMPPLKIDEIKKAVTTPAIKPPLPPPRMGAQQAPQFQNPQQAPPFQNPPAPPQFNPPRAPSFQPPNEPPQPGQQVQPPAFPQQQKAPQAPPFNPPRAQPLNQPPVPPFAQAPQFSPPRDPPQVPAFSQPPRAPPYQNPPQAPPFNQPPAAPQFQTPPKAFPSQPQRAPPPAAMQPPRTQQSAQAMPPARQTPQFARPAAAIEEPQEEGSPFSMENLESPAIAKETETEAEPEKLDEPPEIEFPVEEERPKPKPKTEKKEKPAIPKILPPPPPPRSAEAAESETEKEEDRSKHKQKKEALIDSTQPELLRALVELVSKSATVQLVEYLKDGEFSLAELVEKTGIDENEIKDVVHRLTCLGLVKEFWYRSAAGSHIRKYKLENTKGTVEFDLLALKDTLPIEELKAKSTRLVALITTGGRMPKSVLLKALPVMDDEQLEQVIRYTERFKLPSIRDMLTVETKISLDAKPLKQEEAEGEEKPPEVTDLYYEIDNIQKSLGELE